MPRRPTLVLAVLTAGLVACTGPGLGSPNPTVTQTVTLLPEAVPIPTTVTTTVTVPAPPVAPPGNTGPTPGAAPARPAEKPPVQVKRKKTCKHGQSKIHKGCKRGGSASAVRGSAAHKPAAGAPGVPRAKAGSRGHQEKSASPCFDHRNRSAAAHRGTDRHKSRHTHRSHHQDVRHLCVPQARKETRRGHRQLPEVHERGSTGHARCRH